MPRTFALLAILLGSSVLALVGGLWNTPAAHALSRGHAGPDPRFVQPLRITRDCKPRAPVAVELAQTGASDGSVVTLQFRVLPHPSVGVVAWELQVPPGARLLEGEVRGSCASDATGSGMRQVRVHLDPDADLSRINLVATGSLVDAPAGAGAIGASIALTWGDPQAAWAELLPSRPLLVVGPGIADRVVQVPSRHRNGR